MAARRVILVREAPNLLADPLSSQGFEHTLTHPLPQPLSHRRHNTLRLIRDHALVQYGEVTKAICMVYSSDGECRGTGFLGKTKGSDG
jgi:hypothetical protein